MTDPLLSFDALGVDLDDRALVEAVTLDIAPGERVGIIGESGSGKSVISQAM